ncbi:LexA/Signal peptidase [Sparassis latifolia]|uniref:Mitochondrial inner membrane protease subunit n=1 Tax=Sparassis crispa TaxID=139825 RepID=A0A401GC94_9APHY|nr:Mitochondrial inner membrane protease subunit 2 [Sparassis crispa]GBE79743.1 Mitochondrial inner membrane protease subunit 2 [Sparassis crispa]
MSRPWSTLWKQCRSFISGSKTVKRTLSALIWLPSGVYFTQYFYVLKSIKGTSMQPTLNPDTSEWRDIVIFDRFTIRWLRRFERGDVVALRSPTDSKLVVKRIIALEGDTVKTLPPYPDTEINIPQGHAWVEGDEPFRSEDSNYFGPVPLALIESKLSFIVWPLSRYGPIQNPSIPEPKSLRRPGWRRDIAQIERQQWRNSRVKIAE